MVTARMVMTTQVLTVEENTPAEDAMRILVERGISGLPVVGEGRKLVGLISEKDLLPLLYESGEGLRRKKVGDLMHREVASHGPEDSLKTICDVLVKRNFRRVPIVEDGRVVGIVSRRDVLRYILKFRQQLEGGA